MRRQEADVAVIGGGCAGMAAALAAKEAGAERIIVLERSAALGGVLRQCIHNGFGIHRFQEDLTGVEYAARFLTAMEREGILSLTETAVLSLRADRTVTAVNREGLLTIEAKAVVVAAGCRERPRGALLIPGSRPAGVITAGAAQRYLNLEGYLVGRRIVILGSGDIGLIMARQFVLEGAEVLAVAELQPYSSGLTRNIVQCVEDFNIPLYYNTTVTEIQGEGRLTGVVLSAVGPDRRPLPGTERLIPCDTLVLSVGLIPENELLYAAGAPMDSATGGAVVDDTLQTGLAGVFACGNALHVHDLVDFVTDESERAGRAAARFVQGALPVRETIPLSAGRGVRGLVPQRLGQGGTGTVHLQFRPAARYTDCTVVVRAGGEVVKRRRQTVLTPGEMCEIKVERTSLQGDITVEVEV